MKNVSIMKRVHAFPPLSEGVKFLKPTIAGGLECLFNDSTIVKMANIIDLPPPLPSNFLVKSAIE